MAKNRRDRLVGSILSLPVFSDQNHKFLLERQRIHIRWSIDQGMKEGKAVILIAGGVGETYNLEDDEFSTLCKLGVEEARGEAPVMVMVAELSAREALRKCQVAADAGVTFVLLSPPHYSPPSEEDIFLHYKYVNDRVDIGIVLYNSFWVMPNGYSFSRDLFNRLADLENVDGVKWSAPTTEDYLGYAQLFSQRFNLIQNRFFFSLGSQFGTKGYIDVLGNAAPRFSLHQTALMEAKDYKQLDALHKKVRFDPVYSEGAVLSPGGNMVADGPNALVILRSLGLDAGPPFPGQADVSPGFTEYINKQTEASGIMEWVDWDQEALFKGV